MSAHVILRISDCNTRREREREKERASGGMRCLNIQFFVCVADDSNMQIGQWFEI